MASRNEATVTFRANTEQFKQGINQAKTSIGNINAQLRLNAQQMQQGGNSAQLMAQRVDLLTQKEREQQSVVDNLERELDEAKRAYGENSEQVQKQERALTSAKATLMSYSSQLDQAKQKLAQSETVYGQTSQAIEKQEAEMKRLKQEYANAVVEKGKDSEAARKLERQIRDLSTELGQNREKLSLAEQGCRRIS